MSFAPGNRNNATNPYQQGQVVVQGKFANDTRELFETQADANKAIFQGAGKPNIHNMQVHEFAFMYNENGRSSDEPSIPAVLTSLQGLGDDELLDIRALSNDPALLTEAIESRIQVIGTPIREYNAEVANYNQDVGIQTRGMKKFIPINDAAFGALIRACVPTLSEADKYASLGIIGDAQGKTPLVAKVVDPQDIGKKLALHSTAILRDRSTYLKVMGEKYQTVKIMDRAVKAIHDNTLTQMILGIHSAVKLGLFKITLTATSPYNIIRPGAYPPAGQLTLNMTQTQAYLAALATNLGLLESNRYTGLTDIIPPRNNDYQNIRVELCKATHWDYSFGDNAFGYDSVTHEILGLDSYTQKVKEGTAYGSLLKLSNTCWTKSLIAYYDLVLHDLRNVMGRVVKSANEGFMGAYFLQR